MPSRACILLAALLSTGAGLSPAFAQGVPIIDLSKLHNLVSRLTESAADAAKQQAKIGERSKLAQIEQEQLEAYEAFLADTTGSTNVSSFEAGPEGAPSAEVAFPKDESNRSDAKRLFGDGASVEDMIIRAAAKHENDEGVLKAGLSPTTWRILLQSLVKQESAFNNAARSYCGAIGFTQLMPATAKELGVNPYDPQQNLEGGARYLSQQLKRFGRVDFALAAYNAGAGNVNKYHGIPPFNETQGYVRRISGFYDHYLSTITGADMTGSLNGVDGASADWGNMSDAGMSYSVYSEGQVQMAMRRITGLLRAAKPMTSKEAMDQNTYMLAERARLMALTLRLRAANAKVNAAKGLNDNAQALQNTTFWEYSDAN